AVAAPSPFGALVSGLREGRIGLRLIQRQQLAPEEVIATIWGDQIADFVGRPEAAHVSLINIGRDGDQAAFDAAFAAARPTLVIASPMTFGECGPRGPFLANALASDDWEIVDGF